MAAAARALWLSELAQAIEEAQCVAWRIGVIEGPNTQALELYVQLEAARAEVEALRGRAFPIAHALSHAELLRTRLDRLTPPIGPAEPG